MNCAPYTRTGYLNARCDEHLDRARHEVARRQRQGETLNLTDVLALVRAGYIEGARAMADAITFEMNRLHLEADAQRESLLAAGRVVEMTEGL